MTMIVSGSTGLEFPDGSDQTSAFTGNAAAITSGTLDVARLPTSGVNAASITAGTLDVARLPTSGVNAASITTGTLAIAQGGTGTASPSLVSGTNISITGTWPNQTVTGTTGAPTTAQVLAAYGGATANAVGTYAFAKTTSDQSNKAFGGTRAGSQLTPASAYLNEGGTTWAFYYTPTMAGTWQCMGQDPTGNYGLYCGTLWLRIS